MGHFKPEPSSFEPNQPEVQPDHNLHGANNGYVPSANQNDQHQPHTLNIPESGSQPQQFSHPPHQELSPGHKPTQQHPVNHHQYPNYHTQPAPNPHTDFMYPNRIHQPVHYPTHSPPPPPPPHRNQAYPTHEAHHPPPPPPPPQYHNYGAQNVSPAYVPSHARPPAAYDQNAHVHNPQFYPHNNGGQAGYAAQGIPVPVQNHVPTEKWSSELFDCMDDPVNAVITACFPCITFGQIAEIVDNGSTPCGTSGLLYGLIAFLIGVPCIMSCTYRTKLRSRYGLLGRVCFTGLGKPGQDCIPVRCLVATFRERDNLTCTVKESHFRRIKLTRFPPGSVLSQTHRPILLSLAGISRRSRSTRSSQQSKQLFPGERPWLLETSASL